MRTTTTWVLIGLAMLCYMHIQAQFTTVEYVSKRVLSMPQETQKPIYNFQSTDKIQQSFKLNSFDPNLTKLKVEYLFLAPSGSPGGNYNQIKINIYEGTIGNLGALIHSQPYTYEFYDVEVGFDLPDFNSRIYTVNQGLELESGKNYVLEIEVPANFDRRSLGFHTCDYSEGTSNRGNRDVWMSFYGTAVSKADPTVLYSEAGNSVLELDTMSGFFPELMLNKYEPRNLNVHSNHAGNLSYHSKDETIAKVELISSSAGNQDKIEVMGYNPGETRVAVILGTDTINHFVVSVTDKRVLSTSIQYIKYPGESNHSFLNANASIAAKINDLYDPINITVRSTDQGVKEYEWDLDQNGESYDAARKEVYACTTQVANSGSFYTNFYLLRVNKNDAYFGAGNGGGSSIGFGLDDGPSRYGYVSLHLFRTEGSLAATLAHEMGHNLGLVHYSSANTMAINVPHDFSNMMKTGRQDDLFFGFQWRKIHRAIDTLLARGESYEDRAVGQITIANQQADVSQGAYKIQASTNSDSKIIYKLESGNNVIDIDNDGNVTLKAQGTATITAYIYATDNYTASKKTITLTVSAVTSSVELEEDLLIFPNPTSEFLWISSTHKIEAIFLTDVTARTVLKSNLTSKIDVSNLPSGVYVLKILQANGNTKSRKVIVN